MLKDESGEMGSRRKRMIVSLQSEVAPDVSALVLKECPELPAKPGASQQGKWVKSFIEGLDRYVGKNTSRRIMLNCGRQCIYVFLTGGALYPNNWTQMTNPPSAVEAREISAGGDKMALAFAENFRHGGRRLHGIGRFIFFLGGFPVLNKLLAWSLTKRYNRYVSPGFNPTAKKSEGV